MSIIRRKKNNKPKLIILLIIVLIIIIVFIKYKNAKRPIMQLKGQIVSLDMAEINSDSQKENIYSNDKQDMLIKYNTIFVPMDAIFKSIFEDYNSTLEEQTIKYNNMILEINKKEKRIRVPNQYNVNGETIDDTVDVEIENIDDVNYIPIYLLSNINGIEVLIDDTKIYDKINYINSLNAIDNNKQEHTIQINSFNFDNSETLSDTEYVGEYKGALWREEAYKRIEKYRKSNVNVIIKDKNENVLNNAKINIKMINNAFKFGSAVRMSETTKQNGYNKIIPSLFNSVGSENGFKWSVFEKNGSSIPKDVINYAKENNMYVRGHYLWQDNVISESLKTLIGNIENTKEGTMAYIYKQYDEKTITEEQVIEEIKNLKINFENIVLTHIENEMTEFPEVQEWDVINEPTVYQYFKYYLYDKHFLTDSDFLFKTNQQENNYVDNDEFYKFLAKCFDKANSINSNAKLVINDPEINGSMESKGIKNTIKIINNIKKYTDNIDAIGVQYHVYNRYRYTPQSYYNKINNVLDETGIKEAIVTEFDNFVTQKLNNYSDKEKKQKADYLRDSLIAEYSNKNVSGFYFLEEEQQAYEELMQEWLHDEQNGITSEDGTFLTKLYKGEYIATVELNGITKEVPITVSDDMQTVEITLEGDIYGYGDKLEELIKEYNNFETTYSIQINSVQGLKSQFNTNKQNISNTTYETDANYIITQLEEIYKLGNILIQNKNKIPQLGEMLKNIEKIGQCYKDLLINNIDTTEVDIGNIQASLNAFNNLIEINKDLKIQDIIYLKNLASNYYNEINNTQNYLKKYNYISSKYLIQFANTLIEDEITQYMEANPITISYSTPAEQFTNQNVTVTVNIKPDTQITNNHQSNTITFTENDKFTFEYSRRGKTGTINVVVNNIDKIPPSITGVENGKSYATKVKPIINELNLKDVRLYKGGQVISSYKKNTEITEEGIYELVAQDLADNITKISFQVNYPSEDDYKVEKNMIKNVTSNTTSLEFKNKFYLGEDYNIIRNGNALSDTDKVSTGDVLKTKSGTEYKIIVTGDLNKDGSVTILDIIKLRVYLLLKNNLDDLEVIAADTNLDNKNITIIDLIKMRILALSKT